MKESIKVLWFCNVKFSNSKSVATGSWLYSMSEALIETGEVELFNITEGSVDKVVRNDYGVLKQWVLPNNSIKKNGLPSAKIVLEIQLIIKDIKPDIIHIWGTENYWGLLYARGFIKGNVLLEIQGLKYANAKYFYAGMSLLDIIRCFRLKEFIKPTSSLIGSKLRFKKWGKFEKEMILKCGYISTQSDWVRTYVSNINGKAKLIKTELPLRNEFLQANKWEVDKCCPLQIFTSTSGTSLSYKGLHILLDALTILKKRYPKINLHIAGSIVSGIRMDGYSKWLKDKISKNDLANNITWLGSLSANDIVFQMHRANVVVVPSFIETYCLALDEALTVGVPTVVSFSGAMPELAKHEESALFYPSGDIEMCANFIERLMNDKNLSMKISKNAYKSKENKNNTDIAVKQLKSYKTILSN